MKLFLLYTLSSFFLTSGYTQASHVFAGSEVINIGIVDISLNNGSQWSTERSNSPGYFSLSENGNYIGYSDESNIDGYVKKYGNTSFIFPVGTGKDLRILTISEPTKVTDAYSTAWIEGDPSNDLDPTTPHSGKHDVLSVSGPITLVSKIGQWDWQVGEAENLGIGTTGTGAGLVITVSIPDMTDFGEKEELRLVGWNGSSWIDLSGKATASGNKENSMLSGIMVEGISAIGIGKVETIPFVKIESLNATASFCNTLLKWETSFENNTSLFIIEQSLDGIKFYPIANIYSYNIANGSSYSKVVSQPYGIAYYRLKIQNTNNASRYSSTVSQKNNCNEKEILRVFPNPVMDNEKINVQFTTNYEGKAELIIMNTTGQIALSNSIQVIPGINLVSTDIKRITHGFYFIKIIDSNGKQIVNGKQFIKK
jgi:hypothetical protein